MRPMAAAASTAPRKSIGSLRRSSSGLALAMSTSAAIATGTLIQKIERQVHSVR